MTMTTFLLHFCRIQTKKNRQLALCGCVILMSLYATFLYMMDSSDTVMMSVDARTAQGFIVSKMEDASKRTRKRDYINSLTLELEHKLRNANYEHNVTITGRECEENNQQYLCTMSSAQNPCPRQTLPVPTKERITQLVEFDRLHIDQAFKDILKQMSSWIYSNYDVILLSAVSSNHFLESQALLENLHTTVFPVLSNFSLVVYDIGLTEEEHDLYKRHCRCTLLKFPFDLLPGQFRVIHCFAWKPFMIRAHMDNAQFVVWLDTSIRVHSAHLLPKALQTARERGLQQNYHRWHSLNPHHTLVEMFEYFGDSPCAHMAFHQVAAEFGIYHREPLVLEAILDPWVACGLDNDCMCSDPNPGILHCPKTRHIGSCSRYDQSALSIILAKLFREKYEYVAVDMSWLQTAQRDHKRDYFHTLTES